jgi:hypothetical protein
MTSRQHARIGLSSPTSVNDRFTKRKYTVLPAAFAFLALDAQIFESGEEA